MTHDDYSLLFEDWLVEEQEIGKRGRRSKEFVGNRSYRHFDTRISLSMLQSNEAKVIPYLKNPSTLRGFSFYPFLRRDKKVRRFTKEIDPDTGKKYVEIKQKPRPIMYASHTDACVFGFYAYMLKATHNQELSDRDIESTVIAYRKIPRNDSSGRNKSNIDFAKDIYDVVRAHPQSAVLCLDLKNFFGTMNHVLLRQKWEKLLRVNELPAGHAVVFKAITRYRYIFLYEALAALGLGKLTRGRFLYNKRAKRRGMIANPRLYNHVINNSRFIHKNSKPYGIPQGSPISDILANLYLLEFDTSLQAQVDKLPFGFYRRYSDDILIICPQESVDKVYGLVMELLTKERLAINPKKTELFFINTASNRLTDETARLVPDYLKNRSTIQYLGFEFDLSDIHIRSGTIANHYRKLVAKLKTAGGPSLNTRRKKKRSPKRDRYAYLKLASSRLKSPRLDKQHRTVRKRTTKLRKKHGPASD